MGLQRINLIDHGKNIIADSENANPCSSVKKARLSYSLSITDLSLDLISEILSHLDPKELGILSCVSSSFHRLVSKHDVWKELYCERWGHPYNFSGLGSWSTDEKSWKDLFVEKDIRSKVFWGDCDVDVLYGHTRIVTSMFILSCKNLLFTAGHDQIVRMWDLEEHLLIDSSLSLGCAISALAADTKLLVAGSIDGFVHCWIAVSSNHHFFDLRDIQNQNMKFRVCKHVHPVTSIALDESKIYTGSQDMTIRVWDRSSFKCLTIFQHKSQVFSLVLHGTILGSTAGSDLYVWDTNSGRQLAVINDAQQGNLCTLACTPTGNYLFAGGENGSIYMFELTRNAEYNVTRIATWYPQIGSVRSLAFEFPWLISAGSRGRIMLLDVSNLLMTNRQASMQSSSHDKHLGKKHVECPQRILNEIGPDLCSVRICSDSIVCAGGMTSVRIWNFSQPRRI